MQSFKVGVRVRGESGVSYNAQRFATQAEATGAAKELQSRWLLVTGFEVEPSDDPVNYRFDSEQNRSIHLS